MYLFMTGIAQEFGLRIHLASTLLGTFIFFPFSHTRTIVITPEGIRSRNKESLFNISNEQRIPRIIHQVKLGNLKMQPKWIEARKSCIDLHPDWQFKLWEDEESGNFVNTQFPNLLETYLNYPLEIQRSNVLRYLVLHKFGGIYLDLDLGCKTPLDGLRNESFLTPPANPSGINNAFIASTPDHPFWSHVEDYLITFNRNWFNSPYITNMFSTGCHFLSTMHRLYGDQPSLTIMDQANKLNGHVETPLFEHLGASSWHKGDAKAILRIGQQIENIKNHFFSLVIILFLFSFGIYFAFASLRRLRHARKRKLGRYEDVEASKELVVHHE
ncbi:uncharacterized protein FA14DRAFT_175781 [Meira miltonrushii]|uniref:Glycosyltransferase family 32 protein n=1 Tax=Meira miltonrushii TaxID=1280837 RepID=A0A316VLN3_9BASI|nr:uncharacterized protein FA14DRAFT_175781 [Meira miltonrushii]PWN36465.1 hypothetical protein FA14DRAFT_175781 [Meira miltonrushii]